MRVPWLVPAVVACLAVPARAETSAATPAEDTAPIALATSSPVGWLRGAFGASVYVGPGPHLAMRINFARYDAERLIPLLIAGGESAPEYGTMTDVGIGWIWYPRRVWDGFLMEAGVNRRDRDVRASSEIDPDVETQSTTYAARALIGWSWKLSGRMFLAVAVGASVGREAGHDTFVPELPRDGMPIRSAVTRLQVDAESYWRLGWIFGR